MPVTSLRWYAANQSRSGLCSQSIARTNNLCLYSHQGFLATSFAEKNAKELIDRIPPGTPRVQWRVQVDPRGESAATCRCQDVNVVMHGQDKFE